MVTISNIVMNDRKGAVARRKAVTRKYEYCWEYMSWPCIWMYWNLNQSKYRKESNETECDSFFKTEEWMKWYRAFRDSVHFWERKPWRKDIIIKPLMKYQNHASETDNLVHAETYENIYDNCPGEKWRSFR